MQLVNDLRIFLTVSYQCNFFIFKKVTVNCINIIYMRKFASYAGLGLYIEHRSKNSEK
jgi:hypothetical protein